MHLGSSRSRQHLTDHLGILMLLLEGCVKLEQRLVMMMVGVLEHSVGHNRRRFNPRGLYFELLHQALLVVLLLVVCSVGRHQMASQNNAVAGVVSGTQCGRRLAEGGASVAVLQEDCFGARWQLLGVEDGGHLQVVASADYGILKLLACGSE
jgi:hypothetical protein